MEMISLLLNALWWLKYWKTVKGLLVFKLMLLCGSRNIFIVACRPLRLGQGVTAAAFSCR